MPREEIVRDRQLAPTTAVVANRCAALANGIARWASAANRTLHARRRVSLGALQWLKIMARDACARVRGRGGTALAEPPSSAGEHAPPRTSEDSTVNKDKSQDLATPTDESSVRAPSRLRTHVRAGLDVSPDGYLRLPRSPMGPTPGPEL